LIEDLGSDRFSVREAATKKLKELEDALPALRKARKSADGEVRRRVEEILPALERKHALRCLGKAKALGRDGRVVEVADRLAYAAAWGAPGEEGWESLTRFADRAITDTARHFPGKGLRQNPFFPAGEFRRCAEIARFGEVAAPKIEIDPGEEGPRDDKELACRKLLRETRSRLLVRGEEVAWRGMIDLRMHSGIITASGDAQIVGAFGSVLIIGGNLHATSVAGSIIVCDGDVELFNPPEWEQEGDLIIARGKVTCRRGKLTKCLVRSENFLLYPDGKKIIIKDGTPDPVGFVKFFEFTDVGLIVSDRDAKGEPVRDGIYLKDVLMASPFAPGLRAGDVVTALDGMKAASPEAFRRLLRRKLGPGGLPLTFTVRRAEKVQDVSILVKD
jgi:hypothetical protein